MQDQINDNQIKDDPNEEMVTLRNSPNNEDIIESDPTPSETSPSNIKTTNSDCNNVENQAAMAHAEIASKEQQENDESIEQSPLDQQHVQLPRQIQEEQSPTSHHLQQPQSENVENTAKPVASISVIRTLTDQGTIITTPNNQVNDNSSDGQRVNEHPPSEPIPHTIVGLPNNYNVEWGENVQYIQTATFDGSQYTNLEVPNQENEYVMPSTSYGQFAAPDINFIPMDHVYDGNTPTLPNNEEITLNYVTPDGNYVQYPASNAEAVSYPGGTNGAIYDPTYEQINPGIYYRRQQCVNCGNIIQGSILYQDPQGNPLCPNCMGMLPHANGRLPRPPPQQRPQKKQSKAATQNRRSGAECANCKTTKTTLWRRNNNGEPVCNSCGLYFKLHNVNRPINMKKDTIQTRKRKPKNVPNVAQNQLNGQRLHHIPVPTHHHHHQHARMMIPSTSGYQPAGDVSLLQAQYQQDQYILPTQAQTFPSILRSSASMSQAIQPVEILTHQVAHQPNQQATNGNNAHEEQTTVITSTSTINGGYRANAQDEDDADEAM